MAEIADKFDFENDYFNPDKKLKNLSNAIRETSFDTGVCLCVAALGAFVYAKWGVEPKSVSDFFICKLYGLGFGGIGSISATAGLLMYMAETREYTTLLENYGDETKQ